MKNIVIWGFDSESAIQAINMLKEKEIIEIKAWIGEAPECTHGMINLIVGNFKKESYQGYGHDMYHDVFYDSIYQFMDMMSRHSFYVERSFHDYLNIFNIYYDLFSTILIKNNVDAVLFSNLPHEGPDLILYKIAGKLNIKTVMFYQTIFPNKFFYLFEIDDFGKFSEIEAINEKPGLKIENQFEKSLFYMNDTKKNNYDNFSLQRDPGNLFISLIVNIFRRKNYLLLKGFLQRTSRNSVRNKASVSAIHQTETGYGKQIVTLSKDLYRRFGSYLKRFLQRYSNYREARRNLLKVLSGQIDLDEKFVYFPLHLQPELTTSTLGGLYSDQLLAIERLSSLIPENWYIYVKENPKQTELMRGQWFFERLGLIKKVKVVSPDFNTYLLIKNCVFVATITGTAGWEAISGGKNALVFGNPWFKGLPGVFSYNDGLRLEDIINYRVNHDDLENELNLLLRKTGEGVIDESYKVLVEDFDAIENAINISNFLEKVMRSA